MPQTWVCRNNGKLYKFSQNDQRTFEEVIREAFESANNPIKDEKVRALLNEPECPQDVCLN